MSYRDPVDETGQIDLDAAAEAGWLTRATSTSGLNPMRRHLAVRPVLDVLDEDRGETRGSDDGSHGELPVLRSPHIRRIRMRKNGQSAAPRSRALRSSGSTAP
jgi:hypothetical protein